MNLLHINNQIKSYKKTEDARMQGYEEEIKSLQEKLTYLEKQADKMEQELAIQNIQLNTDELTKIANRNFYNISIEKAYDHWFKTGENLTLAVADIDDFKHINDTYGHLAGDKILVKIASLFKELVGVSDFLARYGGEEFVIIFRGITIEEAKNILENIRLKIEGFRFLYHDKRVPLTVSFGLTNIQINDDINSLFMRADKALYQAKERGKNQIFID